MKAWLIPLISAIAGGLITSMVAPFIKWDIEKRRLKRQARIEQIKFWREEIEANNGFEDFQSFLRTRTFNDLRPYFTKEQQNRWNAEWKGIYRNKATTDDNLKLQEFRTKVNEIEKSWRLL